MVNSTSDDNSWNMKTERREYEYFTLQRIAKEHKRSAWVSIDDSVYSEENSCGLIDIFKKCLGMSNEEK